MTTLKERLLTLSEHVDALDQDDPVMNRLIDMMNRMVLHRPLTDYEKNAYREKVLKMIPPRFNNYKKDCPLKIHYRNVVDEKADAIVAQSICNGICSSRVPTTPCLNAFDFDTRNPQLVLLEFDHWLERDAIYRELRRSLDEIQIPQDFLDKYPKAVDNPIEYILKNFKDPRETVLQGDIYNMLYNLLNFPLLIDDLYGSNIYIRCNACHTASKSSANHPIINQGRYLLRPTED
jgi:hypothetical protein